MPAPGDLGLLQAFINTFYDLVDEPGTDVLETPAHLRRWFADQGLVSPRTRVSAADLDRALSLREGLRRLISDPAAVMADPAARASLNRAIGGADLQLRVTSDGVVLKPAASSGMDRALGALLAIVPEAQVDGSWARLKVCPGTHCGWVFYDQSRNNSGRWCSMNVCGGREKARAHYRRQRGH